MATAVQILCVLAYTEPDGTNSGVVARSLRTNPVVVRRLLKSMEQHGLVEMRPGKDGGVRLRRTPDEITLDQIHEAIEADTAVFALRPVANAKCPVGSRMKDLLTPIFEAADGAVAKTLRRTTLRTLVRQIA